MADANMDTVKECVFWVERFAMLLLVFFSGFEWCYSWVVFILCFTNIINCASYFFFDQQEDKDDHQLRFPVPREVDVMFWMERPAMVLVFLLFCTRNIQYEWNDDGQWHVIVGIFLFTNSLYLYIFIRENHERIMNILCTSATSSPTPNYYTTESDKKGSESCKELKTEKDNQNEEKANDTDAEELKETEEQVEHEEDEDDDDDDYLQRLKASWEIASIDKYREDFDKKMRKKKEKWQEKLKKKKQKHKDKQCKWDEEKRELVAQLGRATAWYVHHKVLLQYQEEDRCKWEEERSNLVSKLHSMRRENEENCWKWEEEKTHLAAKLDNETETAEHFHCLVHELEVKCRTLMEENHDLTAKLRTATATPTEYFF